MTDEYLTGSDLCIIVFCKEGKNKSVLCLIVVSIDHETSCLALVFIH